MTDHFELAGFADRIGDDFVVDSDIELTLVLTEAKPLLSRPDDSGPDAERSFSLLFRGPNETPFEQQTVILRHHALGEFAIFLVPVAQDEDGRLYEAIYNRSG